MAPARTAEAEEVEEIVRCKKCRNKVKHEGRAFCSRNCERLWKRHPKRNPDSQLGSWDWSRQ